MRIPCEPVSTLCALALLVGLTAIGPGCLLANREASAGEDGPSVAAFDRRAREGAQLTVVFFGGSLTYGANASRPYETSYRGRMMTYLWKKYPKSSIRFIDAAIGGTGSNLGIFRLERDVLRFAPDIVFLDFTANDDLWGRDPERLACYESLVRTLIEKNIPVVQAFFGFKFNFGKKYQPKGLPRVNDHKKIAAAYGTGTADLFPRMHEKLESGALTLDQVWPFDSAHPGDAGYGVFFEAVRDGYEQAIEDKRVCRLPDKWVFPQTINTVTRHHLVAHELPAGWTRKPPARTGKWFDGTPCRWMDDVAVADLKDRDAVKPLTLTFTGTRVALFGECDGDGLAFTVKIDGEAVPYQPNPKKPARDTWPADTGRFGGGDLFLWRTLHNKLKPGTHTLEIMPVFPDDAKKGQLRIESICFAGP